jgi:TRAP-type mannitol/chloroaromatic compound transport system permease large subunit
VALLQRGRPSDSLVGHVRGGLGHVNVVGSMIFSGMSGSAVADVAGMGAIEVKAMLDAKYDRNFVAAVTASSAVGPIIPPSIPAILYGSIAEVSVGKLFMGAHLSPRGRRLLDIVRNLLVTAFCLVLLPVAIRVTRDVHSQLGVAIDIPLSLIFASLPVTLVLMAWWSLRLALRERRAPAPE